MTVGTILPYAGDLSKIPNGWALCNGENGTPDLRNRFLTGAGASYTLGTTGGENYHTLSISEMPSHNHEVSGNYNILGEVSTNSIGGNGAYLASVSIRYLLTSISTVLSYSYAGGDMPHENRPPFYAVYWIMKVA